MRTSDKRPEAGCTGSGRRRSGRADPAAPRESGNVPKAIGLHKHVRPPLWKRWENPGWSEGRSRKLPRTRHGERLSHQRGAERLPQLGHLPDLKGLHEILAEKTQQTQARPTYSSDIIIEETSQVASKNNQFQFKKLLQG